MDTNHELDKVAATYERTSAVDVEEQELSLAAQRAANTDAAQRQGYRVDPRLSSADSASGHDNDRAGLLALREVVANRSVDAVFVCGPGRLARDLSALLAFAGLCRDSGVKLFYC